MEVKQIATILNEAYDEITGESAVVAEDLSNIVTVGQQITSNSTIGDNFDNFVKAIIDKVGKTVLVSRTYRRTSPDILVDDWVYGSILEKVRFDVGDYENNIAWDISGTQTFDDLFGPELPEVTVKYFNKKLTFSLKITYAKPQVLEAFTSREKFLAFFAGIENRVAMKMEIAIDKITRMAICNMIAEKIQSNNNVVNLLALYNTATGSTLTASNAYDNTDFLRFATRTIIDFKRYVADASMLYNNDGYVTFTPSENLKIIMLSEFATALETNLVANTYNKEFVQLDGYSTVSYWQGTGTTNDERSSINVLTASTEGNETRTAVTQSGIVCVMFDEQACVACCKHPVTEAQYNPQKRITNYFHMFDAMYYNDLGENCIVFVIDDTAQPEPENP